MKRRKDSGVTIVEYAILLALIAIAIAISSPTISSAVIGTFDHAASAMTKAY